MFKRGNIHPQEEGRQGNEQLDTTKVMKSFLQFLAMSGLLFSQGFADSPLECSVSGTGKNLAVTVNVVTPHPGEMVIRTPDDRTIWLQADHIPFQYPVTDTFEQLSEFVLDMKTRGSWFNDWGEPEAVSIFSLDGTYELTIARSVDSGREDSSSFSCRFSVSRKDASDKN